ncbi:MAG TPA: erythromycin esterase family protein [Chitinophagaceae bacterium]
MREEDMYNIEELAKLKYHDDNLVRIGFGFYKGSAIAGCSGGCPCKKNGSPPATNRSWEYLLHAAGNQNKLFIIDNLHQGLFMKNHMGHRTIGVVYNPQFEKYGNSAPAFYLYGMMLLFIGTKGLPCILCISSLMVAKCREHFRLGG